MSTRCRRARSPAGGSWCSRVEAALSDARAVIGEGPFGALLSVLTRSRELGFLGPGPIEPHIARSLDARDLIPDSAGRVLDLGSGGGLPGLPLALARPDCEWVLLDGSVTRGHFLVEAVEELGIEDRVSVYAVRAEEAARTADQRASFDTVVARSFGPPAVTAECGAPFLKLGGTLVVAEPPEASEARWPEEGLATLGLEPVRRVKAPSAFQVMRQAALCPDRYPRRTGIPAKRPLF